MAARALVGAGAGGQGAAGASSLSSKLDMGDKLAKIATYLPTGSWIIYTALETWAINQGAGTDNSGRCSSCNTNQVNALITALCVGFSLAFVLSYVKKVLPGAMPPVSRLRNTEEDIAGPGETFRWAGTREEWATMPWQRLVMFRSNNYYIDYSMEVQFHAILSVLAFATLSLFSNQVVSCFWPYLPRWVPVAAQIGGLLVCALIAAFFIRDESVGLGVDFGYSQIVQQEAYQRAYEAKYHSQSKDLSSPNQSQQLPPSQPSFSVSRPGDRRDSPSFVVKGVTGRFPQPVPPTGSISCDPEKQSLLDGEGLAAPPQSPPKTIQVVSNIQRDRSTGSRRGQRVTFDSPSRRPLLSRDSEDVERLMEHPGEDRSASNATIDIKPYSPPPPPQPEEPNMTTTTATRQKSRLPQGNMEQLAEKTLSSVNPNVSDKEMEKGDLPDPLADLIQSKTATLPTSEVDVPAAEIPQPLEVVHDQEEVVQQIATEPITLVDPPTGVDPPTAAALTPSKRRSAIPAAFQGVSEVTQPKAKEELNTVNAFQPKVQVARQPRQATFHSAPSNYSISPSLSFASGNGNGNVLSRGSSKRMSGDVRRQQAGTIAASSFPTIIATSNLNEDGRDSRQQLPHHHHHHRGDNGRQQQQHSHHNRKVDPREADESSFSRAVQAAASKAALGDITIPAAPERSRQRPSPPQPRPLSELKTESEVSAASATSTADEWTVDPISALASWRRTHKPPSK